jgi:hypothetical protein
MKLSNLFYRGFDNLIIPCRLEIEELTFRFMPFILGSPFNGLSNLPTLAVAVLLIAIFFINSSFFNDLEPDPLALATPFTASSKFLSCLTTFFLILSFFSPLLFAN